MLYFTVRQSQALLLIAFICAPFSAASQVRVYNPETGSSEAVENYSGKDVPIRTNKEKKVEKTPQQRQYETIKGLYERSGFVKKEKAAKALGKAEVFVDAREFDRATWNNIKKLQKLDDVEMVFYMRNHTGYVWDYMQILRADFKQTEEIPEFVMDVDNTRARRYRLKEYEAIVYTDPFGQRRLFSFKNGIHRFTRALNAVRKKIRDG